MSPIVLNLHDNLLVVGGALRARQLCNLNESLDDLRISLLVALELAFQLVFAGRGACVVSEDNDRACAVDGYVHQLLR